MMPVGHTAVYLDHVCADGPLKLRMCQPGRTARCSHRPLSSPGFAPLARLPAPASDGLKVVLKTPPARDSFLNPFSEPDSIPLIHDFLHSTVVPAAFPTHNRVIIASVHSGLRATGPAPEGWMIVNRISTRSPIRISCPTKLMTRYSRQDVLRILQISPRQLQGWERAGLIPSLEQFGFPELTQLRTLRELQTLRMRPASIRNSVQAMKAVSGMSNPLMESAVVRTGARLAFRHSGTMVDPIRRQLLFDFESAAPGSSPGPMTVSMLPNARKGSTRDQELQVLFLQAVQAEEQGRKSQAMEIYNTILSIDRAYTAALINLGTLHYHQKLYSGAEELYRRATVADPTYVLAFFDLGNVLDELQRPDESIAAYTRAIALAPAYADAHYNLALAYERKGERRRALAHWQVYVRLDKAGPWADHARGQIRKLLGREKLSIASRSECFFPPSRSTRMLELVAIVPRGTIVIAAD